MAIVLKDDFSGFTNAVAGQKVYSEAKQQYAAALGRFWILLAILILIGTAVIAAVKTGPAIYVSVQALVVSALIGWATLVAPLVVRLHRAFAQLRAVEHGLAGELAVANALATLDDNYYIINDLTIALGEQETQIDHVVVSPSRIWCIETKNWHGKYRPGATGWLWKPLSQHQGKPRWHKDPQVQSIMHAEVLKKYLSQQGFSTPVSPLVVLVEKSAEWLGGINDKCPVLHLEDLIPYIKKISKAAPLHDSSEVAKAILHAHLK